MPEHWTSEEIEAYKKAIKLAPKQRKQKEKKRPQKLDKLFNRIEKWNLPHVRGCPQCLKAI